MPWLSIFFAEIRGSMEYRLDRTTFIVMQYYQSGFGAILGKNKYQGRIAFDLWYAIEGK